ncbi:Predicted PurR-regulated permease PerM [Granulicella rosea]|uniref:Predicted PurR-regulated permease PerM n=1 Tax=Granulicella rosea TaxID=474952 RepID=A0A239IFC9_9BACT|nr:AI-2E family transporter [Granulicella rosea]SNS92251.1 Predicted PurR-regulated permease PerM [Granulicella rosea]
MTTPNEAENATRSPETDLKVREQATRANIVFFFTVILLLFLAWHLTKELEMLYVSALFAVVLMPIVDKIRHLHFGRRQLPRAAAIVILIVGVLAALTLFFTIGLPPVMRDLHEFMTELPKRIPTAVGKLKKLPIANQIGVDTIAAKAENAAAAVGSYVFSSLPNWLSHVFDILTCAFLCIYFMLEGEHAYAFFLSLFGRESRIRLDLTLKKAEVKMSKWLIGQGLLMLTLGVCSLTVFGLLHVRYFILLGALMGLLNIIPIAGGVITIILAAGVAALDSWTKMAGVLIFYGIYVNLENAVLTPRIMRSSVNLMGLTVLVSLLIGTALAGIVGALVAVPTAALITVLLDEYAVRK